MSRVHSILFLSSALTLAAACGGGEEGDIEPKGPVTAYVVSQTFVPTSSPTATEFGLDLNGDKVVDNQLGSVLATLGGQGFNVQAAVDTAVNEGGIILLMEVQAENFSSAGAVGLQVFLGDMPMPAACASTTDTTCRKHLDGNGSFSIGTDSPTDAKVTGKIAGGTFTGGPGNISLKIALGGPQGVQLDLSGARAKATGISADKIDSVIVAGALTQEDLNTQVIPAIHTQLVPIITEDCPTPTAADCGCMANSTGKTVLGLFDTNPKNCVLTVEEISNAPLIKSLLAPDVTIDGKMALSLGLKVSAVKATIRR